MDIDIAKDMEGLRDFLLRPEIWERAAEDDVSRENFMPFNAEASIWLVVGDYDAAISVHMENGASVRIHPYIANVKESRSIMFLLYEWLSANLGESINKINASIPKFDRKLYNFAMKVGFVNEGINRESYLKGGEYHDLINLGITRAEMEDILNGQDS